MTWLIELVCCGQDDGFWLADTWEDADEFRESYCDPGDSSHVRSAIIRQPFA